MIEVSPTPSSSQDALSSPDHRENMGSGDRDQDIFTIAPPKYVLFLYDPLTEEDILSPAPFPCMLAPQGFAPISQPGALPQNSRTQLVVVPPVGDALTGSVASRMGPTNNYGH